MFRAIGPFSAGLYGPWGVEVFLHEGGVEVSVERCLDRGLAGAFLVGEPLQFAKGIEVFFGDQDDGASEALLFAPFGAVGAHG